MSSSIIQNRRPQAFSQQRGGQRAHTLSVGYQSLNHHSGGDPAALIASLLTMPSHSVVLERVTQLININIMRNISSAYRSCPTHLKPIFSSLVANVFSRPTLASMGFPLSKSAYHNARSHVHKSGVGVFPTIATPQSKQPTSAAAIDSIRTFLTENSQPTANRTILDQHKQHVPARTLNATTAELWRKYIAITTDKQLHVSRCQFYKIITRLKIFKHMRQRGTDMCEICVAGQSTQRSLKQSLSQHDQHCLHALAVRPYATMTRADNAASRLTHVELPLCKCPARRLHTQTVNTYILPYLHHRLIVDQQHRLFKQQVVNLQPFTAQVVIDFKQNIYINRGSTEVSAHHYHRSQRSVLGMRIDWMDAEHKRHSRYVDFISILLNHDSHFVVDCLDSVIQRWKTQYHINEFIVWTDQGKHFICKRMFAALMKDFPRQYQVDIEWNRFVEHHGKSAVDAHFSMLSRWLKEAEREPNAQISTTDELMTVLRARAASHQMADKIDFELYCPKCVCCEQYDKKQEQQHQQQQQRKRQRESMSLSSQEQVRVAAPKSSRRRSTGSSLNSFTISNIDLTTVDHYRFPSNCVSEAYADNNSRSSNDLHLSTTTARTTAVTTDVNADNVVATVALSTNNNSHITDDQVQSTSLQSCTIDTVHDIKQSSTTTASTNNDDVSFSEPTRIESKQHCNSTARKRSFAELSNKINSRHYYSFTSTPQMAKKKQCLVCVTDDPMWKVQTYSYDYYEETLSTKYSFAPRLTQSQYRSPPVTLIKLMKERRKCIVDDNHNSDRTSSASQQTVPMIID